MITEKSELSKISKLTRKGYSIKKSQIHPNLYIELIESLKVSPVVHKDYAKFAETFYVFCENKSKIYLPKFWAIKNLGPPNIIDLKEGDKININCKYQPLPFQGPIIKEIYDKILSEGGTILSVACGMGKCHGKNTPILMYDGSIKMVQNIKIGDKLMGDDSTPRNVLSLARGKEQLYKIIPKRGNPYIVNESHILSLKVSTNKNRFKKGKGDIIDISVKDYLNLPKSYRGRGSPLVGFKVPVEFEKKYVDIEPYIIGLWLGDGTSSGSGFTTNNHQIIKYLKKELPKYNMYLRYKSKYDYSISNDKSKQRNYFNDILRKYNLLNNKHIPHIFKCNSRENRLKLLAGLIDSDGYMKNNIYSITQKNERLLDDIVYLCLSLGFYAEKKERWKSCTNGKNKEKRKYFQTTITGFGIEKIPVKINRKKCNPRKQIKNPLHSLIQVEKLEVDDYYGFMLDGNHRYLLGDFTVTHNTFMSLYISSKLGFKTLVVVHTSVLLSQWIDRINQFLPNARVGIIRGNKFDSEDKDICIAMLQTLVSPQRIFKSDAFNSFGFLIVDECHRIAAPTFSRALPRITTKYMLGLSATPNRPDKLEKVFKWYLGDIGVFKKREDGFLIVKYIKYTNDNYREIRRSWNNSYDLVKMVELIIKCKERNNFIVKQAIKFAQTGRQILILSSRRQHLKNMEKLIKNYKNTEIKEILEKMFPYETVIHNNIMKFYEMDITCGLYIGQMKPSELEISSKCNIILGTYSLVSEGTDIPTLNTLIMASPKKSIEQVVGRILRAETGFTPLVLDMCDDFSVYTNQGRARQKFYNSNDYHIDTFTKHNNEPLMYNKEEIFITDEKQTCGVIKKQRGRRKNTKKKQEKPKKQSKCLIDISDSD